MPIDTGRSRTPLIVLILLVPVVIAMGWFLFSKYGQSKLPREFRTANPVPVGSTPLNQPSSPVQASPVAGTSAHVLPGSPRRADLAEKWKAFRDRFGPDLGMELAGQQVALIRSTGPKREAPSSFNSSDSQQVLSRARQVLEAAADLLGIDDQLPVGNPMVQASDVGGEVSFHESWNGIPLAPEAGVTIQLGARGDLRAIYSKYVPSMNVTNHVALTLEQAKEKVIAALNLPSDANIQGGAHVIWIGTTLGYEAYEFFAAGKQIVIDAETGAVLFQRDRTTR